MQNQNNNFSPSSVFSYEINVSNENNLNHKIIDFIKRLDQAYKDFISNRNLICDEWNEFYKKNSKTNNVFIYPEKMFIKSPMTILNSPWGAGKTHFIEQIAKNWDSLIIKSNITCFKKFIVLDVWEFCSSSSIADDLINRFFIIWYQTLNKEKIKNKEKLKKWIKQLMSILKRNAASILAAIYLITMNCIFPDSHIAENFSPLVGIVQSISDDWNNNTKKVKDNKNNLENDIKEMNEAMEYTIVVFDNVERMGVHTWEIIKTIQKLSLFEKILIILPLNKSQLKFCNEIEYKWKNESSIDKYISLGLYFEFKQDYFHLLKDMGFDEDTANMITDILNKEINGYKLSIRSVEKSFKSHNVKGSFDRNKYEGLKSLKKIWNTNFIDDIVNSDIQELQKDIEELQKVLLKNKINFDSYESSFFYDFFQKIKNNLFELFQKNDFYESINKCINFEEKGRITSFSSMINGELLLNLDSWFQIITKMENEIKKFKKNEIENKNISIDKFISNTHKNINQFEFDTYRRNNFPLELKYILTDDDKSFLKIIKNNIKKILILFSEKWKIMIDNKNKKILIDILKEIIKDNNYNNSYSDVINSFSITSYIKSEILKKIFN